MAFFNSALASAEEEQARLRGQLKEEKLRCRRLAHLAAPAQDGAEKEAPASGIGGDSVPAETHQALQVAMDKLQVSELPPVGSRKGGGLRSCRCRALTLLFWLQGRFTALMQEKVDLKEQVEELDHRCIQLSGETDTIGEWRG